MSTIDPDRLPAGSVYIATSTDGFIAREDGAIDWLPTGGDPGEDYGYRAFMDSVDAMVIGRATYDVVRSFGGWAYGDMPVVVLSTRQLEIPAKIARTVETMSASPTEVMRRLAERGVRHVYVDGGRTIQAFLADGLIRRLILTRVPLLIGRGLPLFGRVPHDIALRHVETRSYPSGLVQTEYEVVR
jgi:dihydrofolate reductase